MTHEPQPSRPAETPEPRAERSQGESSDDTKRMDYLERETRNVYFNERDNLRWRLQYQIQCYSSLRAAIDALRPNDVATEGATGTLLDISITVGPDMIATTVLKGAPCRDFDKMKRAYLAAQAELADFISRESECPFSPKSTEAPGASTEVTPETDAKIKEIEDLFFPWSPLRAFKALSDFARDFEIQRNALRAELAKVREELEVIKCPTTHQAIVKQIIADRARLEADNETLTHELEHVWKPAAAMNMQYANGFETDRDALRLLLENCPLLFVTTCNHAEKAWIANVRKALSSTAGDELRGVLKQAHGALTHAVENCAHCAVLPTSVGEAYFDAPCPTCQLATAVLAALSRFLPIGKAAAAQDAPSDSNGVPRVSQPKNLP